MPELPEVETIRLGLQRKLVGKTIKSIEILNHKSFLGEPKLLQGKKVLKIKRRAKILGIDLTGDLVVLFHLKMTGQLILVADKRFIGGHPTQDMRDELPNKSTRVIFSFNDGSKLYFNDQRKFGWVRLIDSKQETVGSFFDKFGPEPLEKEFTWQVLKQNLLRHKSQPIKVALLDQTVVSGIGNIYASECCFNAKLDPRRKVSSLEDNEFKSLYQGVIKALQDGIKYGGSSRTHFVSEEGKKGYFLDYAFVYWKDGSQCKICGSIIKKIKLGGRGTYYCERCQK